MKKIFSTILMAFAAALLLVPGAKAQTPPPYVVDKYLTSDVPNANGEYTLRIETYATGSVENVLYPSDIVLVLDMSGSMRYDYYSGYPNAPETLASNTTLLVKETGNYTGTISGTSVTNAVRYAQNRAFNCTWRPTPESYIANTCLNNTEGGVARYYKHSDGNYYLVHQGGSESNGWTLYYKVGNSTIYLWKAGTTTTRPAGTSTRSPEEITNALTVYAGNLYRYKTRLEMLQDAVVQFMEAIKANSVALAQQGKSPNRVAIVQFSGMSSPKNSIITTDPQTVTIGGTEYVDHTFVRRNFTQVTASNATSIENSIRAMKGDGETPVHAGMRQARLLLAGDNTTNHKFVVVFTDGEPRKKVGNSTDIENFYSIVSNAMADANLIKRTSGINAEIFTMGLAPTTVSTNFLQYLSSMYVDPVTVTSASSGTAANYSGTRNSDTTTKFYQDDATADFSAIFSEIAEHISEGSTTVVNIDLVADSFKLPDGADASRVKAYTAQCTGENSWGSLVAAPSRGNVNVWVRIPLTDGTYNWVRKSMDIDNGITASVDTQNGKVTVGGFDYQTLWCGKDDVHGGYHGYKLVFDFPIVVKDNALGGIDVPTNKPTSGLYPVDPEGNVDEDNPIIFYPIPDLDLPIKLIIQKAGLAKGESASFTIERRKMDGSDSWTVFTSFVLTGTGTTTNPEVRFLNLDASYYYRVAETGWSWSYESAPPTHTSTENIDPRLENPIIFTNTPKTTDVPKHAEAKAVNTMKSTGAGSTTVYD